MTFRHAVKEKRGEEHIGYKNKACVMIQSRFDWLKTWW